MRYIVPISGVLFVFITLGYGGDRTSASKPTTSVVPATDIFYPLDYLETHSLINTSLQAFASNRISVRDNANVPSRPLRPELWGVALYEFSGDITQLPSGKFNPVLSGAMKIIQACEQSDDFSACAFAALLRQRLSEIVVARIVQINDVPPNIGLLRESILSKAKSLQMLRMLEKKFPSYKERLASLAVPLKYDDMYAIYQIERKSEWPNRTAIGPVFMDGDIYEDIARGSIKAYVVAVLLCELERQGLEMILRLREKSGHVPENRAEAEAIAKKWPDVILNGETIPFADKKVDAGSLWKACHYARKVWTHYERRGASTKAVTENPPIGK